MAQKKRPNEIEPIETGWSGLYWAAAAACLINVALIVLDISMSLAGWDSGSGELNAAGWFAQLQQNAFWGLRNLGIFNVINMTLGVVLYLALYRLHRQVSPVLSTLALILCVLSTAIYVTNNPALTLLSLSQQHAAATTEAERALLETTGAVLLAQAEDFTPGSLPGFLLSSLSSLMMMVAMLRGQVVRRWAILAGLVGMASLLVFTMVVTIVPSLMNALMILAMIGGLLLLAWQIVTMVELFRQAAAQPGPESVQQSLTQG